MQGRLQTVHHHLCIMIEECPRYTPGKAEHLKKLYRAQEQTETHGEISRRNRDVPAWMNISTSLPVSNGALLLPNSIPIWFISVIVNLPLFHSPAGPAIEHSRINSQSREDNCKENSENASKPIYSMELEQLICSVMTVGEVGSTAFKKEEKSGWILRMQTYTE